MSSGKSDWLYRYINGAKLFLRMGNIVEEKADAIVTAANSRLAGGGGVDAAVHNAGGPSILAQCRQLGECPRGKAVVTGAGNLKAKIVIHAVGPVWSGGSKGEPDLLRSAYQDSLLKAVQHSARSVVFPSISTGTYGYPVALAAEIAVRAVVGFLRTTDKIREVGFILFTLEDCRVYEEVVRQVIDRPTFGCYWDYYQNSDGLYLHPLHFNGVGEERSRACTRWLRELSEDPHWEEDTLHLLHNRGWREHLGAAVSYFLCSCHHAAIVSGLWTALKGGSWVSPQLLVVLSQRDPHFTEKLEKLLVHGVKMERSGDPMVEHVVQGPGGEASRLGKIANAALGLARAGVWQPSIELEQRAHELAREDYDGADDIAANWLKSLALFERC